MITRSTTKNEIAHVVLSAALAAVCLFSTLDPQGARALTIFGYSPAEIATGKMDGYRGEAWRQSIISIFTASGMDEFSEEAGSPWKKTEQLYAVVEARGLHNAYLDLWVNWGMWSLLSFALFVVIMLYSSAKLTWINRGRTGFSLYAALMVCVVVIVAAIFGNPLLQLKYVWIFFGLAASLQINEEQEQALGRVN